MSGALYLGGVMTVILCHASLLLKKNCSGYICNFSRVYKCSIRFNDCLTNLPSTLSLV